MISSCKHLKMSNVKCLVLPCSERTLTGESKILNETKFVGETQSNIMYLCSSRAFVRQQVVTKLATNFTTRLTRQDHRPGQRYNDGADSSQQKKARCTISSQALEICTKFSMCTNIASGQNSWSVKVCRRLVIHQIQSVRCYNKLVTDLSRFILGKKGECGSHTRLIQIQIHLSRFLLEEKGKCG